ncbi:uncharacterized protein [Neodiprion pinetum]|uniref:uncharacterized protein n=1 Tax=Neodiprion pinetum TaxID=441929 RepID=UPI0037228C29
MNAKVGTLNPWPADLFTGSQLYDILRTTDNFTCERGRMITEFMVDNDFVLLNGRTVSDSPAQPTYENLGSSIIDLIWIDIPSLRLVNDLVVQMEPSMSDHYPVCLSISLETYTPPVKNDNPKKPQFSKIKWTNNAADPYLEQLSNLLIPADTETLATDNLQSLLHCHMYIAAEKANLVKTLGFDGNSWTTRNPWFDSSCKVAKSELRKALKKLKNDRSNNILKQDATLCKNKYREICKAKKKAHIDSIKSAFANVTAPTDFWAAVRKFSFKHSSSPDISIDSWNKFYAAISKPRVVTPSISASITNDILDAEIWFPELNSVLKSLKPGKAAGPDLLTNELFQTLTAQHTNLLIVLFNRVLNEERVPKNWAKIWLSMLHKKGAKISSMDG